MNNTTAMVRTHFIFCPPISLSSIQKGQLARVLYECMTWPASDPPLPRSKVAVP